MPCTYFCLLALSFRKMRKMQDLVLCSLQSWLGFLPMNIVMAGVSPFLWQFVLRVCMLLSGTGQYPTDPELWHSVSFELQLVVISSYLSMPNNPKSDNGIMTVWLQVRVSCEAPEALHV